MSNAVKYTPKGDITLTLASNEENGVKYTTISVEDTGHGISKESLKPYLRTILSRQRKISGFRFRNWSGTGKIPGRFAPSNH